jgi:hypothetical protein
MLLDLVAPLLVDAGCFGKLWPNEVSLMSPV